MAFQGGFYLIRFKTPKGWLTLAAEYATEEEARTAIQEQSGFWRKMGSPYAEILEIKAPKPLP